MRLVTEVENDRPRASVSLLQTPSHRPTPSPQTSPACPQSRRPVPPARARDTIQSRPRISPFTVSTISAPMPGTALRSIAAACSPLCSVHTRCGLRSSRSVRAWTTRAHQSALVTGSVSPLEFSPRGGSKRGTCPWVPADTAQGADLIARAERLRVEIRDVIAKAKELMARSTELQARADAQLAGREPCPPDFETRH